MCNFHFSIFGYGSFYLFGIFYIVAYFEAIMPRE